MHGVVTGSKASAGQLPLVPVQYSGTSHWPASALHSYVVGRYSSTQVSEVPEQWSAASSSQTPPLELPEHGVVSGWNASVGQEPLVPEQNSATSHWPAAALHSNVVGWYSSTQLLEVPEQWSAASSSQAPPFELPVQGVVSGWNASAGQSGPEPVQ